MPELMIVTNPTKKKRKTKKKSPVKKKSSVRKKTAKRPAAKPSRKPQEAANMAAKKKVTRKRKSVAKTTRKATRRTPRRSAGGLGKIMDEKLIPAAIGGASAVFLNIGLSMLPVPAVMKSKPGQIALKSAAGIIGGMAISKMFDKKIGTAFTLGSLTVLMSEITKGMMSKSFPQLALNEYVSSDDDSMNEYMSQYMSEYVSTSANVDQLGYSESDGVVEMEYDFDDVDTF